MPEALRRPGLTSIIRDQSGATAVEYGLILGLVVLAMLVALNNLADATIGKWNYVANRVSSV